MRFRCAGWTIRLAALLISGASAAEDSADLLQRIKTHIAEHLAKLPNYTCRETVNRFMRSGGGLRHLDTLDLDVVFAGGHELFAQGGSGKFDDQPMDKLVSSGTMSNNALGSHVDLLLSEDEADFQYAGIDKKDGRKSFRFNITVPLERSRFLVKHNSAQAMSGYQGSLWVDIETYDLVRADFKVNRIPSHVGVSLIEESFHYKKLPIGNSEFYLPERSEVAATDKDGVYTLNLVKLDRCREYAAESDVKYAPPSQGTADRDRQDH